MQEKKKVSSSSAVNAVGTYSLGEEIANAVTHGLAVLLSIAGLVLMIIFAVRQSAGALAIVSTSIFGASMIILIRFRRSTTRFRICVPNVCCRYWTTVRFTS